MSLLSSFQWYRRMRGGRWAKVTGYFWGQRWIRLGPECRERGTEVWKDVASWPNYNQLVKDYDEVREQFLEYRGLMEAQRDKLLAQLPETMQHCTILSKRCEKGHAWLTATNWFQYECQQCEFDRLEAERDQLKKLVYELETEADPAGLTRERLLAGDENKMLQAKVTELATRHEQLAKDLAAAWSLELQQLFNNEILSRVQGLMLPGPLRQAPFTAAELREQLNEALLAFCTEHDLAAPPPLSGAAVVIVHDAISVEPAPTEWLLDAIKTRTVN